VPEDGKPSRRIVYWYGEQDNEVAVFLRHRRLVKRRFSLFAD
jgi:hypothetical protein